MLKRILSLTLALLILLPLASCGSDTPKDATTVTETKEDIRTEQITATAEPIKEKVHSFSGITPENDTNIVLASENVYEWWSKYDLRRSNTADYYSLTDTYFPNSVTLKWKVADAPQYFRLSISRSHDLSDAEFYTLSASELTLSHLFTGVTYYWRVDAVYADKTLRSALYSFKTAESPRTVMIEGVSNTRDIGGMITEDGLRIKQGMIYRGALLEDITDAGRIYVTDILGIKTDLDLRASGDRTAGTSSPIGADTNYINISGRYYTSDTSNDHGINTRLGMLAVRKELRVFANPDNYPIYIHCSLGRDRTGTLVFLIEALLGAEKDDIYRDYELSVFSAMGTLDKASINDLRTKFTQLYNYINTNYEGKTYSKKVEAYMLDIGIKPEEIASIRSIMLEEVK